MKICHITSMHDAYDDRIFERACRALTRAGHQVVLIATGEKSVTIDGVRILPLPPRPPASLARRLFSSFDAFRIARKLDADIFIFHDPDLIPWMTLLGLMGRRVVFDIHENFVSTLHRVSSRRWVRYLITAAYRFTELITFQALSGLITTTGAMARLYDFTGLPTLPVHNTVDLTRLEHLNLAHPKTERPTIYTSGSNTPARNAMQTVEALPMIVDRIPDVKMIFVGRYRPEGFLEELKAKANLLGVEEHIEFHGMVPWDENFARTAAMQVGCVFYEDNANSRVALPNRLFEYMTCGVAVLGHDFPEIRQVVESCECGVLVDSASPEDIARGAIELLQDRKELALKQDRGRKAIDQEYAYHREVERMSSFFASLMD